MGGAGAFLLDWELVDAFLGRAWAAEVELVFCAFLNFLSRTELRKFNLQLSSLFFLGFDSVEFALNGRSDNAHWLKIFAVDS